MRFCPNCGNILVVMSVDDTKLRDVQWQCTTCDYALPVEDRVFTRELALKNKEVDDVLGGSEAWANVDSTEVTCPKCDNRKAYFMQIQTRSADEPSSIFYKMESWIDV